jgi:hypothetical protein
MNASLFHKLGFALLLTLVSHSGAAPLGPREEAPLWRYTVKPGDTLISIAERYFIRADQWPRVRQANGIDNPLRMLPGTVLRIPVALLRQAPGQAELQAISGVVRWRSRTGAWQDASEGLRLIAGSSVETQEDSSALLVLADGSRIVMAPASVITLDTLSQYAGGLMADSRLRLQRGQTDIIANPEQRGNQNLKILTPSAQTVVRGTHFRLGADAAVTRVETIGGLVSVDGAGKSVSVAPGRGTVAKVGQPPLKPVALLEAADVSGLPGRFERLPLRFSMPILAGAKAWQGQIAPDKSFERILLDKSAQGEAMTFADLPNGDYVLRLRAVDANGLRGLDALHPFTVFARPFPPGLNAPGDGATIRVARPRFAWGNVLDVARYRVQVSLTPDFSRPLHDEMLDREAWQVPEELTAGKLQWRVASIVADGQQGPWSAAATFAYKPGPGATDLGRAALRIEGDRLSLMLPLPGDGLSYEAILSSEPQLEPVLASARSDDGALDLPRPEVGSYYLGVRLVDRGDNTPGPTTTQKIDLPPSPGWLLLLVLPWVF